MAAETINAHTVEFERLQEAERSLTNRLHAQEGAFVRVIGGLKPLLAKVKAAVPAKGDHTDPLNAAINTINIVGANGLERLPATLPVEEEVSIEVGPAETASTTKEKPADVAQQATGEDKKSTTKA